MSGAERTRRYRERRQQGIAMAQVKITHHVLAALIETGRLDFTSENDGSRVRRENVNEAIAELLKDWAAASQGGRDVLR